MVPKKEPLSWPVLPRSYLLIGKPRGENNWYWLPHWVKLLGRTSGGVRKDSILHPSAAPLLSEQPPRPLHISNPPVTLLLHPPAASLTSPPFLNCQGGSPPLFLSHCFMPIFISACEMYMLPSAAAVSTQKLWPFTHSLSCCVCLTFPLHPKPPVSSKVTGSGFGFKLSCCFLDIFFLPFHAPWTWLAFSHPFSYIFAIYKRSRGFKRCLIEYFPGRLH